MRRDDVLLVDILQAAQRIARYLDGVSRADFVDDEMRSAAVQREILIMGEAANAVSQGTRDAHPEVPWRRLVQLRNFYIHAYSHVDALEVWRTATGLVRRVERLITALVPAEDEQE